MNTASPLLTLYYWRQGFVLLAPSFVLDRRSNPYRRLAATLMHASGKPITLETGESDSTTVQAALVAPKVPRRRISAIGSQIMICDLALATPAYNALAPMLEGKDVLALERTAFEPLEVDIARMHQGALEPQELQGFIHRLVHAVSGKEPETAQLHPKLLHALRLIDEHPMQVTTLPWLAEKVALSPDRLRHLFAEQVGSSLAQYLRWAAVFKGGWLWSRGTPLLEVAEQIGFHDLAHANHAFNDIFGLNPSYLFKPGQVRLFRCEWT